MANASGSQSKVKITVKTDPTVLSSPIPPAAPVGETNPSPPTVTHVVTVTAKAERDGVVVDDFYFTVVAPDCAGSSPDQNTKSGYGTITKAFTLTIGVVEAGTVLQFTAEADDAEVEPANVPVLLGWPPEIWWFNGEKPANFPTEGTINLLPVELGSYLKDSFQKFIWTLGNASGPSGAGKIEFKDKNGQWGASAETAEPQVTIRSKAASKDKDDYCEVRCLAPGPDPNSNGAVCTMRFCILRPTATFSPTIETRYNKTIAFPCFSWYRYYKYEVKDQFGRKIQHNLPVHEEFSDHQHGASYPDKLWPLPTETSSETGYDGGDHSKPIEGHIDWFYDTQLIEQGAVAAIVPIVCPNSSDWNDEKDREVDNHLMIWYGGSRTKGKGIAMIRVRVRRKRGRPELSEEPAP